MATEIMIEPKTTYTVQVASNADAFQAHRRLSYTVEATTPDEAVTLAAAQHAARFGMSAHAGPAINVSGGENAKWGVGPWSCWIV